jgi:hypothetical protein
VGSGTLNGVPISFTTTFSAVDYNFGGLDYTGPAGSGSAAYVVSLGDHSILVTLADGTTLRGRLALFFGPLAHAIVWETAEVGFAGSSIRVDYQRPAATTQ